MYLYAKLGDLCSISSYSTFFEITRELDRTEKAIAFLATVFSAYYPRFIAMGI
jgi:hypothetical protein